MIQPRGMIITLIYNLDKRTKVTVHLQNQCFSFIKTKFSTFSVLSNDLTGDGRKDVLDLDSIFVELLKYV